MAHDNKKSKHISKPSTSKKSLLASKSKPHLDIKKIWLLCTATIAIIAVVVFIIIAPSAYKSELSEQGSGRLNVQTKSDRELIIEDLLGIESTLEETSNLDSEKVVLEGIYNKTSTPEENCKGKIIEESKNTFFDNKNNFSVVEHKISVNAGIRDKEFDKYSIGSDGVLYTTSVDNKKYKAMGGLGIVQKFDSNSSHYNKYIDYGILGITCKVSIVGNYSDVEKGYTKELDTEDENFGRYLLGTDIMWGVYADGNLTTNSDTYIVIVGKDSELNDAENDVSENALSNSHTSANPYPNLKEDISPITEIHIFNFDFTIDEKTKEFVNKWSYAVNKNLK
ncbi:hypothetical protein IKG49_01610 [Candidatus Saccharibacteria bacterium]|nr:hypothetical protein [Candidatus Saccharibacteria bacterium]